MLFVETSLKDSYVIELESLDDSRGFFARSFCRQDFREHGIPFEVIQCNLSYNKRAGTLRGMHYQAAPHEEAKLITCLRGALYDVIIDLRPTSPTYMEWFATELNADNRNTIYVPKGFAHGFQTLAPHTEVLYYMSNSYHPESQRGIRWDDPSFKISWPIARPTISDRDRSHPVFIPATITRKKHANKRLQLDRVLPPTRR